VFATYTQTLQYLGSKCCCIKANVSTLTEPLLAAQLQDVHKYRTALRAVIGRGENVRSLLDDAWSRGRGLTSSTLSFKPLRI